MFFGSSWRVGCFCIFLFSSVSVSEEKLSDKLIHLTWLSVMVQGYLDYGPDKLCDGDELLKKSVQPKPEILDEFEGMYLKVRRVGSFSSVLFCRGENLDKIAEDAGCTPSKMDLNYLIINKKPSKCEFELNLKDVCE